MLLLFASVPLLLLLLLLLMLLLIDNHAFLFKIWNHYAKKCLTWARSARRWASEGRQ